MNFRPAKLKVILSLGLSALIWVIVFATFRDISKTNPIPNFFTRIFSNYNFSSFFSTENIIIFIIQFVVFYILFSLFQRKRIVIN